MAHYIKCANPLGTYVDPETRIAIRMGTVQVFESLSDHMKACIRNRGLVAVSEAEYQASQGISVPVKEDDSVPPTGQSPVPLGNEVDSPLMENPSSPEGKVETKVPLQEKKEEEAKGNVGKQNERKRRRL